MPYTTILKILGYRNGRDMPKKNVFHIFLFVMCIKIAYIEPKLMETDTVYWDKVLIYYPNHQAKSVSIKSINKFQNNPTKMEKLLIKRVPYVSCCVPACLKCALLKKINIIKWMC